MADLEIDDLVAGGMLHDRVERADDRERQNPSVEFNGFDAVDRSELLRIDRLSELHPYAAIALFDQVGHALDRYQPAFADDSDPVADALHLVEVVRRQEDGPARVVLLAQEREKLFLHQRVEAARLWISGIDLLDGTPVLDIKPYVPYADIIGTASNSIASAAPEPVPVQWAPPALHQARDHAMRLQEPLVELIEQCLAQDPRPAYQVPTAEREYGAQFWDVDVRWHYPQPGLIRVLEVIPAKQ